MEVSVNDRPLRLTQVHFLLLDQFYEILLHFGNHVFAEVAESLSDFLKRLKIVTDMGYVHERTVDVCRKNLSEEVPLLWN